MNLTRAHLTRRRFINISAGTAATFTFVRPEAVRGTQTNSKIKVGLIGSGNRGTFVAGIAHSDPRAEVTALCDPFDDQLEKACSKLQLHSPALFKDFEKLLSSDVDAVIIATPPFEHPRMLEAAVASGKHIYCEKPMGVDFQGCRKVMAAGEKAGPKQIISVGFQQRYGQVYLEAYKRLKEGQIGELVNARASWISSDPFKRIPYDDPKVEKLRNWFCYKDYSGDFIVEQDCHNFDVLHWFLGALPVSAVGKGGRKVRTTMEILDHLSLTFFFPDGIHVNYEANQITPRGFSRVGEEFTGTKGVITTSRAKLSFFKEGQAAETVESKREITKDAVETFLGRVLGGEVENATQWAAESTMIALLGRAAIYSGSEVTWKGEFGS